MTNRYTFPRTMRLSGSRQFAKVYDAKIRANAGPLLIYAVPNALGFSRLGLAVPGRVGTNVVRNTIKRRLREAFRFSQHKRLSEADGYDLVISVRPHSPLDLVAYQELLQQAIDTLHKTWAKRTDNSKTRKPAT